MSETKTKLVKVKPKQDKRHYYRVIVGTRSGQFRTRTALDISGRRGHGQKGPFANPAIEASGYVDPGVGSGFPRENPPFTVVYEDERNLPMRDFEDWLSYWIVSPRALSLLREFDAEAGDVIPANVKIQKKTAVEIIDGYHVYDVIRFADALDMDKTTTPWNGNHLDAAIFGQVFKQDLPNNLHLFRLPLQPEFIWCSHSLFEAIKDLKLTNISFEKF